MNFKLWVLIKQKTFIFQSKVVGKLTKYTIESSVCEFSTFSFSSEMSVGIEILFL